MSNSFSISVIIPTYNRRHTLPRAINSVLNQKVEISEIIIIDDGSTDGTSQFISSNYPSLKYIYQNNRGVSAARNIGIKSARSNWIAFLDSDDEWLNTKLVEQLKLLKKHPEIKFIHTDETWIRNNNEVKQKQSHKKYGGYIFNKSLEKCRISPSTVVCKRSLLIELNGFDEDLLICEDYDLWLRITSMNNILFINKPLIKKYGGHEDQLSINHNGIEKYHIQSLEKLIWQNFPFEQNQKMIKMLITKIKIFAQGAKKRGRIDTYHKFIKRIDELSSLL